MDKFDTKKLLEKYRAGEKLSEKEQLWLDSFYLHTAKRATNQLNDSDLEKNLAKVDAVVQQQIPQIGLRKINRLWYAAASVVAIVSLGLYFSTSIDLKNSVAEQRALMEQITPGSDKAILELANGERLNLDGTQTLQSGDHSILLGDSTINLHEKGIHTSALNTLRIPQGGQYKVVLSDGSTVWLNAGSQLRYPSTFTADSREVELIGEAYFEVSHNPKKPFYVRTQDQDIQVLGTGFNVKAYANSRSETTLAHGKVRVNAAGDPAKHLILQPGDQAYHNEGNLQRKKVDVNTAIAWKNGLFSFKRSNLQDITQQLERWYDIDFVFRNPSIPTKEITGEISRQVSLYDVAEILSYFDLSCQISGRTVYLDVKK